jgi:hypothetical protein
MLNIFVLLFAIALSIYTERVLIPISQNPLAKAAARWGYINSILMALAVFHPVLKILHTVYILVGAVAILFVADSIHQKAEMEDDRRRREAHAAELRRTEEKLRRMEEKRKSLLLGGCPAGYECAQMGLQGEICLNRDACKRLP